MVYFENFFDNIPSVLYKHPDNIPVYDQVYFFTNDVSLSVTGLLVPSENIHQS